jgi:uncharacterized LabA/DUF88 family protein
MRRVGVYVDASNVGMNGGHGMRYDVLRDLSCRNNGEAQRLNAYVAFDQRRAEQSPEYGAKSKGFQSALRDQGFRVTVKTVKHFKDEEGAEVSKSNADLDMAVDALTESERLDTVLLVTGDGDFVQVVRALQSKGCRVEVLGFDNVSRELRDAADQFINGYLIPGLLPVRDAPNPRAMGRGGKPGTWLVQPLFERRGLGLHRLLAGHAGQPGTRRHRNDARVFQDGFRYCSHRDNQASVPRPRTRVRPGRPGKTGPRIRSQAHRDRVRQLEQMRLRLLHAAAPAIVDAGPR